MFGQPAKPAFGGTGFGTQSGGGVFGSSNTSFGSSGGFGTTSLFGSQTPGASTGGLFGTTTTQSGGLFGSGTSTFGQNTLGGGFGSQQSTGLFGSSGQQTSSLFSTPGSSTSSGFGAKTPATGFGSAVQGNTTFGTPSGTSSLFGSSNPAGSGTTGGLFGSTTTSSAFTAQTGTTIKFNPPSGQDTMLKGGVSTNISTRHQCITAMKEYESKSLEELRMEDYLANRKGPQAGSTGLFATPQTTQAQTGFTFGTQNKTTGFGGFGQTTSSGPSLFGQQTQSGGLFGSTANKTTFGTTTTTASTGFGGFGTGTSMFGQNKSIFGQPTTTQSGGLFGSTQTGTSSFGGFGSTQTGFGTSTTGGLFGSKPASFAQPSTNTGLTFGQQNTLSSGGLFGNKPAGQTGTGLTFGQSSTTGFGTSGGLFGNKSTGFGTGTNTLGGTGFGQTGTNVGGGFNTGGLFSGTQNKPTLGGLGTSFGFNLGNTGLTQSTTSSNVLGQTVPQNQDAEILEQLRKVLMYSPYGDSPLFRNLENDTVSQEDLLKPTNPLAQKAALTSQRQYKVSPTSATRIKPKPITIASDKSQLFDGLEDEDLTFGDVTFVPRRSIKKLNIKTSGSFSKQGSRVDTTELDTSQSVSSPQRAGATDSDRENDSSVAKSTSARVESPRSTSLPPSQEKRVHRGLFQNISGSFLDDTISELNNKKKHSVGNDSDFKNNASNCEEEGVTNGLSKEPTEPHPAGIILRRHGYYTVPGLDALADMVDSKGDCIVDDFVVGREGYGSVMFPGKTNVRDLNLDEIVFFRRKEITVYPVDEEKPPEGSGLNKRAQVTLDCVWPCDKSTKEYIMDPERLEELHYQEKLEQITAKIGAKFLDYRPETGSWVFEVEHFSKYGLIEDDDEEDLSNIDPEKLAKLKEEKDKYLAVQKQKIKTRQGQKPSNQDEVENLQQEEGLQKMSSEEIEPKKVDDAPHLYPLLTEEEMEDDIIKEPPQKEFVEMEESELYERAPASHQLASHLGVLAEDLQLKKASFFGDEDMVLNLKEPAADARKQLPWMLGYSLLSTSYTKRQKQISPQKPVVPHYFPLPFDDLSAVTQKPGSVPLAPVEPRPTVVCKPKTVISSRLQRKIPLLSKSLFENKQNLLMDLGLMHAKRFRIGWGPLWNVVHGGQPLADGKDDNGESDTEYSEPQKYILLQEKDCVEKSKLGTDDQRLLIEQIIVSPLQELHPYISLLHQAVIDQMTVQLQYTKISMESGCPQAVPCLGNSIIKPLIKCTENTLENLEGSADSHVYKQALLVWELCQALWGNTEDPLVEDEKPDSYAYQIARQEALSLWLERAVSGTVHEEIERIIAENGSEASVIFQHLTGHQLQQACDVAQQNGSHQMALLISQASGVDYLRNYLQHQLTMWNQLEMDQFIKPDRLKTYVLLAGIPVWRTSSGSVINVCEGLDWKRAMAVHLWYQCPPTCTVSEALKAYKDGFESTSDHNYAAPPLPPYLEFAAEHEDKQDVCYQLIQLFCDRGHPLHKLLSPTSAIPNYLDYRISWQLSQVLKALEYTHLSEFHSALLCTSYAAQLESMGLWYWAAFVLIHIADNRDREHAVLQLLERHISLHPDKEEKEHEKFLEEVLKIPIQWIHKAKAIKAGHCNEKDEEAWHWLKAGHWNKAHQLILSHLASKAIVNENFADLKCLLSELGSPEVSSTIENWDTGGRVFLDYITMMETLQQLQQSEPSANELDKLQSEVFQLSRRITGLKCHTATDRLCQSEMAKRAANLMRTLLQMKMDGDDINEMLVTETTDLPLPEDYALQELHQLTRCYMIGVTMS